MTNALTTVYGIIYLITNLVNGKRYVGQTIRSLRSRFRGHVRGALKKGPYWNNPLQRSIRKHGEENFKIEPLCFCQSAAELDLMEDLYIVAFDTMNLKKGYNLKRGGGAGKVSEFTKLKQSKNTKGTKNPRYIHDVSAEEVSRLYLQGNGLEKISEILGISTKVVSNRLQEAGTPTRHTGRGPLSEEDKQAVGARMKIRNKGKNNHGYRHDVSFSDVVHLYEQGNSPTQISKIFSVSPGVVVSRLKEVGVSVIPTHKGAPAERNVKWRSDLKTEEIVNLYNNLVPLWQISKILSADPSTIRNRLKKAGVTVSRKPDRSGEKNPKWRNDFDSEEVVQKYLQGYTSKQLQQEYSIGPKILARIFKTAGIKRRTGPRKTVDNVQPITIAGSTTF